MNLKTKQSVSLTGHRAFVRCIIRYKDTDVLTCSDDMTIRRWNYVLSADDEKMIVNVKTFPKRGETKLPSFLLPNLAFKMVENPVISRILGAFVTVYIY